MFKEGNKDGKQFSSTYQPENRGRKGKSVTEWLSEYGDAKELEFEVTITKANGSKNKKKGKVESLTSINQLIAVTLINKAVQGDNRAISTYLDRTEGKSKQPLEVDMVQRLTPAQRKARIAELLEKANEYE